MGRSILINAVLDGHLSYIMMAVSLPPGVIAKVDKRRRSFLWTGESDARGSNCLIAWDQVRQRREDGGLGIWGPRDQGPCHSEHMLASETVTQASRRRTVIMGCLGTAQCQFG